MTTKNHFLLSKTNQEKILMKINAERQTFHSKVK